MGGVPPTEGQPGEPNPLVRRRLEKLEALRRSGIDPFGQRFGVTHWAGDLARRHHEAAEEKLKAVGSVAVAGRVVALRHHGKTCFAHLRDQSGQIQLYARSDALGERYASFTDLDVGDFIGVTGELFRTRTGELTVAVRAFELLAKSLRPLPEKWHGLKDVETRYRRRYVDLVMNPQVRETFVTKSRLIRELRAFLEARGFLEVETPMMQPIPGGAAARPFVTHHNALDMPLYLRIAPELYLKRLVVGGLDRVYEINRSFRNEGISTQHNPEFTMLEFYQAYADYEDLMALTRGSSVGRRSCTRARRSICRLPGRGCRSSGRSPRRSRPTCRRTRESRRSGGRPWPPAWRSPSRAQAWSASGRTSSTRSSSRP